MDPVSQLDLATRTQVYQWAYRLLQNHHDALDATQEVMLRALARAAGGIEDATAWLRRVTINYCLDVLRRRRAQPAASAIEPVEHRAPAGDLAARELHAAITAALADLSEQQRTVLVAKVYDRQTFAEIAAGLGISTSSAKTHYVRALHALRPRLTAFQEVSS